MNKIYARSNHVTNLNRSNVLADGNHVTTRFLIQFNKKGKLSRQINYQIRLSQVKRLKDKFAFDSKYQFVAISFNFILVLAQRSDSYLNL